MKKLILATGIALLSMIVLTGCEINGITISTGGVRGRGEIISEDFEVSNFDRLRVEGAYEIIWRESEDFLVTAVMFENFFDYFEINVSGDLLQLSSRRNLNVARGNAPRIYIYSPTMTIVDIRGASQLTNWDEINSNRFEITIAGAASIDLVLNSEFVEVDIAGAADLTLLGAIETANLRIAGASNVDIDVINTLTVDIAGASVVTYGGNPEVTRRIAGVGTVRRR